MLNVKMTILTEVMQFDSVNTTKPHNLSKQPEKQTS